MTCAHCGRVMGDAAGGSGRVGDHRLCHPNEPGRPDCYVLVTQFGHDPSDCGPCRASGVTVGDKS